MIEVFVHDEGARPGEQTVKSIVFDNGKYFITYNNKKEIQEFPRETIEYFGWKKDLAILDRKLKLEKLLND